MEIDHALAVSIRDARPRRRGVSATAAASRRRRRLGPSRAVYDWPARHPRQAQLRIRHGGAGPARRPAGRRRAGPLSTDPRPETRRAASRTAPCASTASVSGTARPAGQRDRAPMPRPWNPESARRCRRPAPRPRGSSRPDADRGPVGGATQRLVRRGNAVGAPLAGAGGHRADVPSAHRGPRAGRVSMARQSVDPDRAQGRDVTGPLQCDFACRCTDAVSRGPQTHSPGCIRTLADDDDHRFSRGRSRRSVGSSRWIMMCRRPACRLATPPGSPVSDRAFLAGDRSRRRSRRQDVAGDRTSNSLMSARPARTRGRDPGS